MTTGRACVAFGLLLAWGSLGRVTQVDGLPYAPAGLDRLPLNAAVAGVATIVLLVAVAAWVRQTAEDAASAVIVVLLAVGTQALAWQWPPGMGINGATMLPGAAMLAALSARRCSPLESRGRRGVEAACGVVAACYAVAVASKLYTSGLGWAGPGNIGMQIATRAALTDGPLQAVRAAVSSSPIICTVLGVGTLLIEGGALLFVFPAARLPLAGCLVAMHLGISVLMGLHHYDWMFTAVGWALLSVLPKRSPPPP